MLPQNGQDSRQHDYMSKKQECHHPRPPAMLLFCPVKAPSPDRPFWARLRPFGRLLALEQLLQVDPFSLRMGEQCRSSLRPEVPNDDTASDQNEGQRTIDRHERGDLARRLPYEKRQDDYAAQKIVNQEEYGVRLASIRLRLLVFASDGRGSVHHVDPSLQ